MTLGGRGELFELGYPNEEVWQAIFGLITKDTQSP